MMIRRLLNLLTLLSLLLCVAVVALWVRSYWYADALDVQLGRTNVHFSSFLGRTHLTASCYDRVPLGGADMAWSPARRGDVGIWAKPSRLNVRIGGKPYQGGVSVRPLLNIEALHAILVLVAILVPAAQFGLRMWASRHPSGSLCPSCGYDLRAAPDRCPECGHTPAGATA
jgi:hypothetical protein